jgi:PAS domain S-box-containing protein
MTEAEARLAALFEQASDGIFLADLDGRYTDVNGAGCRMLGYSREEMVGKTIQDFIPATDVASLLGIRKQLLAGGSHLGEWMLRRKDGTYLPVEVSAKILPDGRWQAFVRDISERRRLEHLAKGMRERLRESEARFRLAFDEAPIGMALVALDGRFVRVNGRLCEIVGYAADELTGKTFQAITHPDDLDADLELAGQLYRGEIPRYQLAKRYIRKDGEVIHVMLSGSILREPSGEALHYIAQVEDITERLRAEEALRLSEAKFSGVIAIASEAIVSIGVDQRISIYNEGATQIFGWKPEEVIGKPLDVLIPERLREAHRRHVRDFATESVRSRQANGRRTIVGLRKNGEEFPAEAAISKLAVDGAQLFTAVLRDVSDQKRQEKEQRFLAEIGPILSSTLEYRETLTRIAEVAVRDLADVCIVDIVEEDGAVRRLEVASRDPAKDWLCRELEGFPLDRSRPHLIRSALTNQRPELIERISPRMVERLAQNEKHLALLRALDPQSLVVVPLVTHGKLVGAIALVSCTPTRLYGPDELRLAEELASRAALAVENARLYRAAGHAIQAREDLLGIVAHELRSPLSTILMQAEMLLADAPADGTAHRRAITIRGATRRMKRLADDLLDVARLEVGRLTIEKRPASAARIIAEAVEAARALAARASLELRVEVGVELPEVCGDGDRLLQVLENLIGNAIKFTESGGVVTVGAAADGRDVLFWVKDTGVGVAAEDSSRLFEPFWQARRGERRGAGLGLPIVKGIVEAHGGRIWAESAPGRGSTFRFTIPAAPREEQRSDAPSLPCA